MQICVLLPYFLSASRFLVDVPVLGDDGIPTTEQRLLGLGILGSMQGFESLHAVSKVSVVSLCVL